MQRLFSTFANGWPGTGLLLQRLVTGGVLMQYTLTHLKEPMTPGSLVPPLMAFGAGILLMIGLWTPIAGAVVAFVTLLGFVFGAADPVISILLATLGASLALIGPGAWSIDARMFGRKQISFPQRADGEPY